MIPPGKPHVGNQANLFLSRRLAQQFVRLGESGRQIGRAIGDLDGVQLAQQNFFFFFEPQRLLAGHIGWNENRAVAGIERGNQQPGGFFGLLKPFAVSAPGHAE